MGFMFWITMVLMIIASVAWLWWFYTKSKRNN